jgi:hypothetical protein
VTSPDGLDSNASQIFQSLKENAARMGLQWQLSMATVSDSSDVGNVIVIFDGDETARTVGVISMIGQPASDRVYVMTVPPAGNYIIGVADPAPVEVGWVAITAGTGFFAVESPILTIPTVSFRTGYAYEVKYSAQMASVGANSFVKMTVYRNAGVIIGGFNGHPTNPAGFGCTCRGSAIVKNTTGATVVTAIAVTATPFISNCQLQAGATTLAWCRVTRLDVASKYPLATAL